MLSKNVAGMNNDEINTTTKATTMNAINSGDIDQLQAEVNEIKAKQEQQDEILRDLAGAVKEALNDGEERGKMIRSAIETITAGKTIGASTQDALSPNGKLIAAPNTTFMVSQMAYSQCRHCNGLTVLDLNPRMLLTTVPPEVLDGQMAVMRTIEAVQQITKVHDKLIHLYVNHQGILPQAEAGTCHDYTVLNSGNERTLILSIEDTFGHCDLYHVTFRGNFAQRHMRVASLDMEGKEEAYTKYVLDPMHAALSMKRESAPAHGATTEGMLPS